ncbi:MAG: glycosyltransferase family 39 protein [Georgfuchsia sp.]
MMNSSTLPVGRLRLYGLGILTTGADIALFYWLYARTGSLAFAHMASFLATAILAYAAIAGSGMKSGRPPVMLAIALLVLFLRGGMLASLTQVVSMPVLPSFALCSMVSTALLYSAWIGFGHLSFGATGKVQWEKLLVAAIVYSIALRLFYLGSTELIFEEAYYWNYAQHPDIGYLDHPPMVAWLIWLFTHLLGNGEFAVRGGAFLCWFVTAFFSFRLTRDIFDRTTAYCAVALVAMLPVYYLSGQFISPDAPLIAFWSMAAYYAHKAIVADEKRAWLWLGVAIGLGAISKYTIALLGAGIILFVIAHRDARKWLSRPEPYIAIVIAAILFSPVLFWNLQHSWSSLAFQSEGRLASNYSFSVPRLIGNLLVLLTPTGILSIAAIMLSGKGQFARLPIPAQKENEGGAGSAAHSYRLLRWLTLFPALVFATLSLFRASKLNWTGPIWLAALPFVALLLTARNNDGANKLMLWCQRAWPATLVVCLIIYGAVFHCLTLGLPGVPYPKNQHLIGWRTFGRDVENLVTRLERETGQPILVVGMDRNRIASGIAYYGTLEEDANKDGPRRNPVLTTTSEHLFGDVGLMYARWFPVEDQNGKTLLLISAKRNELEGNKIRSRAKEMSEIKELEIHKNGKLAGRYYYRLVTGYQSRPSLPDDASDSDSSD